MSGRRHPLNSEEAARRAEAERVTQQRARDAALRVGQTFQDALRSGGVEPEMEVVPAGRFGWGASRGRTVKTMSLRCIG